MSIMIIARINGRVCDGGVRRCASDCAGCFDCPINVNFHGRSIDDDVDRISSPNVEVRCGHVDTYICRPKVAHMKLQGITRPKEKGRLSEC